MKSIQEFVKDNGLVVTVGGRNKEGVIFSYGIIAPDEDVIKDNRKETFSGSKGIYYISKHDTYGWQFMLKTPAVIESM